MFTKVVSCDQESIFSCRLLQKIDTVGHHSSGII